MMKHLATFFCVLQFSCVMARAGTIVDTALQQAKPYDPTEHWEFDFETGGLWKFSHWATPLNYVFVPQVLTLKTPVHTSYDLGGGVLTLRSRFSFLAEPIVVGPEDYFFGLTGSGSLEWWNGPRTFSMFFTAGGGMGYLNSKGYDIAGAQGRNWNRTWFMYSGLRYRFSEHMSLSLGAHFQHVSNGGTNRINPGVNAIGPMMSLGWHF